MSGTAFAVLAAVAAGALGPIPQPTDPDWSWLNDNRDAALEALMPTPLSGSTYATYRSYRDLYQDVLEGYFSIHGSPTLVSLEAVVIVPVGKSIQQQLLEMHMREPDAPLADLVPRVRLERTELAGGSCSAVGAQLGALAKRRFALPVRDLIIIHPVVHKLAIDFGGGTIEARIVDDDHPLAKWAAETLAALRRCSTKH